MTAFADQFRVEVGNWSERWYHDPLPADDRWPTTDAQWPAVSTIKKAADKDWTDVSLNRLAAWLEIQRPNYAHPWETGSIRSHIGMGAKAGLDAASQRGTEIHTAFETLGNGGDLDDVPMPLSERYRQVVRMAWDRWRPTVALAEFVCISRTLGYGGTADAVWYLDHPPDDLDPGYYLVDYKSRASRHTVYVEEAWQVAAYARADYWVIDQTVEGHRGLRVEPLELQGGLILSITPEVGG